MIIISPIDNSFTVQALATRVRQTLDGGERGPQ